MPASPKTLGIIGFALGAVIAGSVVYVSQRPANRPVAGADSSKTLYTCGMHPQVIQDGPGSCPICGMDLQPMNSAPGKAEEDSGPCTDDNALYWRAPMDPSYISDAPGTSPMGMALVPVCTRSGPGQVVVDPRIRQNMGVRTDVVRRGPLKRTLRTVARVEPNERRRVVVTTKFGGWIEKLYVNEMGQFVRRGQRLFSIYSPQAVASQQEYLLALRQGSEPLIRSARERLRFFDLTEQQIKDLEVRDKPERTMLIYSPTTGYVLHKNAVEGAHVGSEKSLFEIVDLSAIWVQADVYEHEMTWLEVGQSAKLSLASAPGRVFAGKVSYIYPYIDNSSRTVRVRLEFENPGLVMKPGMFGTVRIETTAKEEQILVPTMAVLRTGERNLVFVDLGQGTYQAQEVSLGDEGDDGILSVLEGLRVGQRIVTSGQFLLDSESQLNEAVQKMMAPEAPPDKSEPASQPASQPASMPAMDHGDHP